MYVDVFGPFGPCFNEYYAPKKLYNKSGKAKFDIY